MPFYQWKPSAFLVISRKILSFPFSDIEKNEMPCKKPSDDIAT
jgi:hypothetical protein